MVDTTGVTPQQLSDAESVLRGVQPDAANLSAQVADDGMDMLAWGVCGSVMALPYFQLLGDLRPLFQMMADGLEGHAERLKACREDWENVDQLMAQEFAKLEGETLGTTMQWTGSTTFDGGFVPGEAAGSLTGPGQYGHVVSGYNAIVEVVRMQDGASSVMGGLTDLSNSAMQLGADVAGFFFKNPLELLISNGLEFLIQLFKPLDDAIGVVTGNPRRMAEEIGRWGSIRESMNPIGDQVASIPEGMLSEWHGDDGDAARTKIAGFAESVYDLADKTIIVESVIRLAEALAMAIQKCLIGLLSQVLVKVIMTWLVALATAAVSFGASTAPAWAKTMVDYAVTAAKFVKRIHETIATFLKGVKLLGPFLEAMGKVNAEWLEAGVKTVGAVGRMLGSGAGDSNSTMADGFTA